MLFLLVGFTLTGCSFPYLGIPQALGYAGWIGVVLFVGLQAACGALMWRAYRLTGQSFGIALWACALLGAFFGNVLETPAGAIPFYLTLGLLRAA